VSTESEKFVSITERLGALSSSITFENMQQLINQSEYTVNGETYKRRMLKPKDLVELNKLQIKLDTLDDPQKRMDCTKAQAVICLEGLTDEKWDNTDVVEMEIVIGACLLISRGSRQVSRSQ